MEVSSLVSAVSDPNPTTQGASRSAKQSTSLHTYPDQGALSASPGRKMSNMEFAQPPEPSKLVMFELRSSEYCARLPMRVRIFPRDPTEDIVTTVKNFYGLYSSPTSSKGVSFEDQQGNILIARYENFHDGMTVYVRVIEEPAPAGGSFSGHSLHGGAAGSQHLLNGDAYPPQASAQLGQHISRPASRTARCRSPSPNSARGRRSASVSTNPKARSRSSKTRVSGSQGHPDDSANGYSSGDGAAGSSSGRNKEHIGNTEISLDNIVEGGRRKRAKFESSVGFHWYRTYGFPFTERSRWP